MAVRVEMRAQSLADPAQLVGLLPAELVEQIPAYALDVPGRGSTKSLYARDPDGLEFEVVWLVPADRRDEAVLAARKRISRLDLAREKQRYGGQTRGGVGSSVPV